MEFKDNDGHDDVCCAYTPEEAEMRVRAGRGRSARTLGDVRASAVGYFTVNVVIDDEHYLVYGGETWTLEIDTRPRDVDYSEKGWEEYSRACAAATIQSWRMAALDLTLPVTFNGRGEDVVSFRADGWGRDRVWDLRQTRDERVDCPDCQRRIADWPRRSVYSNVPAKEATPEHSLQCYLRQNSLRVTYDVAGNVVSRRCETPICELAVSEAGGKFQIYIWEHRHRKEEKYSVVSKYQLTAEDAFRWAEQAVHFWPVWRVRIVTVCDDTTTWEWEDGRMVFPPGAPAPWRHP